MIDMMLSPCRGACEISINFNMVYPSAEREATLGRTWGQEKLSNWESERHRTHIFVVLSSNDCMVRCAGVRSPHRVNTGRDVASALECGEGTWSLHIFDEWSIMTSEVHAFQTGHQPSSDSSEIDIQFADKLAWLDAIKNSEQKHESSSGFKKKAKIISSPQWDCWCL